MSELKAVIGLINPKSPTNVGGVLRAAGCYDAKQVFFTGSRYLNAKKFHTDTKNVVERIALTGTDNLLSVKPEGAKVVVIELIEAPRRCLILNTLKTHFMYLGQKTAQYQKRF